MLTLGKAFPDSNSIERGVPRLYFYKEENKEAVKNLLHAQRKQHAGSWV